MEEINPDGKQLSQSESANNLKIWKKPILIRMDIKQTLVSVGSGCPEGTYEDRGACIPKG